MKNCLRDYKMDEAMKYFAFLAVPWTSFNAGEVALVFKLLLSVH